MHMKREWLNKTLFSFFWRKRCFSVLKDCWCLIAILVKDYILGRWLKLKILLMPSYEYARWKISFCRCSGRWSRPQPRARHDRTRLQRWPRLRRRAREKRLPRRPRRRSVLNKNKRKQIYSNIEPNVSFFILFVRRRIIRMLTNGTLTFLTDPDSTNTHEHTLQVFYTYLLCVGHLCERYPTPYSLCPCLWICRHVYPCTNSCNKLDIAHNTIPLCRTVNIVTA